MAQINALTRSTGVAVVGDPWIVGKLTAADGARARICLSRDDLTPNSLEAALAGLLRARASEDRLLQVVADQSGRMLQVRSVGARLGHEVDAVVHGFNAFARQTADLAMDGATRRAMALAMDAVECLESARDDFDRSLRAGRRALFGPADLNSAIETFVEDMSGAGARNVSALTSSSPIFVQAERRFGCGMRPSRLHSSVVAARRAALTGPGWSCCPGTRAPKRSWRSYFWERPTIPPLNRRTPRLRPLRNFWPGFSGI